MSIDKMTILAQKRELEYYADELQSVRSSLLKYAYSLDDAWEGAEVAMINDAIEQLNSDILRIKEEIDNIGYDLIKGMEETEII